eukprot:SAG25_NODE_285_length_10382_cov_55.777108_10_plen_118_part_00
MCHMPNVNFVTYISRQLSFCFGLFVWQICWWLNHGQQAAVVVPEVSDRTIAPQHSCSTLPYCCNPKSTVSIDRQNRAKEIDGISPRTNCQSNFALRRGCCQAAIRISSQNRLARPAR